MLREKWLSLEERGQQADLDPLRALPVRPKTELRASTQQILNQRSDLLRDEGDRGREQGLQEGQQAGEAQKEAHQMMPKMIRPPGQGDAHHRHPG